MFKQVQSVEFWVLLAIVCFSGMVGYEIWVNR
jgi:hypothetical protein